MEALFDGGFGTIIIILFLLPTWIITFLLYLKKGKGVASYQASLITAIIGVVLTIIVFLIKLISGDFVQRDYDDLLSIIMLVSILLFAHNNLAVVKRSTNGFKKGFAVGIETVLILFIPLIFLERLVSWEILNCFVKVSSDLGAAGVTVYVAYKTFLLPKNPEQPKSKK